jgi:Tfp pilus assembly protein PilP
MKLTTGIVALAITAGTAWAQNPAVIQNTKNALQGVQQEKTAARNAALHGTPSGKPSGAVPAKAGIVPAKAAVVPAKTAVAPVQATATKPATATPVPAKPAVRVVPAKTSQTPAKTQTATKTQTTAKTQTPFAPKTAAPAPKAAPKVAAKVTPITPKSTNPTSSEKEAAKSEKPEDKKYSMTGKRDPFISPVVNRQTGSGCSTGKKCLDIEQIALHGVVKSDNGMIAVVTNGLNKAYFLRESDPVFNGYVVKITVDSIVFKETFQDRLGKPFTKDVVKRILTPAV